MTQRHLIDEKELLERFPMSKRQLRELRYLRRIPFVKLSSRLILYDPQRVAEAFARLEIKEVQ
jgi:hypothetical protein